MAQIICAGNWKLNKNSLEAKNFVAELLTLVESNEQSHFVLFPPALIAASVQQALQASEVRWGLQNCYSENQGAYTGENSAGVAKSMGASLCLIGHSERRQIFKEDNEFLSRKLQFVQSLGMVPVLCIGETLEQREQKRTNQILSEQLKVGLSQANKQQSIWVAYEPVWAIGTGKIATVEMVQEAHGFIRATLNEMGFQAGHIPLLYGGSVKPDNSKELAKLKDVDGFLIGGASLEAKAFVQIYRNALLS